jgi:hypothetical protein
VRAPNLESFEAFGSVFVMVVSFASATLRRMIKEHVADVRRHPEFCELAFNDVLDPVPNEIRHTDLLAQCANKATGLDWPEHPVLILTRRQHTLCELGQWDRMVALGLPGSGFQYQA